MTDGYFEVVISLSGTSISGTFDIINLSKIYITTIYILFI